MRTVHVSSVLITLRKRCDCNSTSSGPRAVVGEWHDTTNECWCTRTKWVRMACDECDIEWTEGKEMRSNE